MNNYWVRSSCRIEVYSGSSYWPPFTQAHAYDTNSVHKALVITQLMLWGSTCYFQCRPIPSSSFMQSKVWFITDQWLYSCFLTISVMQSHAVCAWATLIKCVMTQWLSAILKCECFTVIFIFCFPRLQVSLLTLLLHRLSLAQITMFSHSRHG